MPRNGYVITNKNKMNLKKQKEDKKRDLKGRVLVCRSSLITIGVKKSMDKFAIKYSEYAKDKKTIKRLNNLWYNRITDTDFTRKLEAFVEYKKNEF